MTDDQIMAIAAKHFRPGHNREAESNFIACVREILEVAEGGCPNFPCCPCDSRKECQNGHS